MVGPGLPNGWIRLRTPMQAAANPEHSAASAKGIGASLGYDLKDGAGSRRVRTRQSFGRPLKRDLR